VDARVARGAECECTHLSTSCLILIHLQVMPMLALTLIFVLIAAVGYWRPRELACAGEWHG